MTYAEAIKRGAALAAIDVPIATYYAQHAAREHAERIGGEFAFHPHAGFAVYAPPEQLTVSGPVEPVRAPEPRHETIRLFEPAPEQIPGQLSF